MHDTPRRSCESMTVATYTVTSMAAGEEDRIVERIYNISSDILSIILIEILMVRCLPEATACRNARH